jgi:hypothetical protein
VDGSNTTPMRKAVTISTSTFRALQPAILEWPALVGNVGCKHSAEPKLLTLLTARIRITATWIVSSLYHLGAGGRVADSRAA